MKNHLLTIVFLISISLPQLSPAGENDVHAVINGVEFSTDFIVQFNPSPLDYWPKSAVSKNLEATINNEELAPWPPPAGAICGGSQCIGDENGPER